MTVKDFGTKVESNSTPEVTELVANLQRNRRACGRESGREREEEGGRERGERGRAVSYTHLRAHETG